MSFVISTLKTLFILFSLFALASSAVYLGFGTFILIGKQDSIGFGLNDTALILLATGAGVIVLTTLGFCAGTGRRSFMMQIYSGCLLLKAIYEVGLGIVCAIRKGKVHGNMSDAWGKMSNSLRDAFETAHGCCGFNDPRDRTSCAEEKLASAVACSVKTTARQEELFKWICVALFIFATATFLNYLLAYSMIQQYDRARKQFRQRDSQRKQRGSKAGAESGKTEEIRAKYANEVESVKSAPLSPKEAKTFDFLPEFLRPTPKPVLRRDTEAPRSTGSMMTYEEIAKKYRDRGAI